MFLELYPQKETEKHVILNFGEDFVCRGPNARRKIVNEFSNGIRPSRCTYGIWRTLNSVRVQL